MISRVVVRYPFLHITSMDRVEEKQCTFVLSGADDIITAMDRDKLVACTPGILRKQLQV